MFNNRKIKELESLIKEQKEQRVKADKFDKLSRVITNFADNSELRDYKIYSFYNKDGLLQLIDTFRAMLVYCLMEIEGKN